MKFKELLKNWGLEFLIFGWFFFVLYPFGPGTTFDSVSFLQAGDNLLSKGAYLHSGPEGLEFAAHRFPLYPVIAALFALAPKGLLFLQLLLFGGSVVVFRRYLKEIGAPKYFIIFFGLFFVITNYYCLWTESLFGLLFLMLLWFLAKEKRPNPIWPITFLLVLLCLTRMVGFVSAGSLFLAYLFINRKPRAVLSLMVGLLTIVGWTLLGTFKLGNTARPFMAHLPNANDFLNFLESLGGLLTSDIHPYLSIFLGGILFVLPLLYLFKILKDKVLMSLLDWFLVIHFYAYIVFLFLSSAFIDASIPFELRTSFPLYLNLIALAAVAQSSVLTSDKFKARMKFILPKVLILCFGLTIISNLNLRENGVGYNSKDWRAFKFTSQLTNISADRIYCNDQGPIQYFSEAEVNTFLLPEKTNLYSQESNPTYKEEMDVLFYELTSSDAIVWIRNGVTAEVYVSYDELKLLKGFEVVYDDWLCLILKKKDELH
jgi:hypothetical protein